eukprot:TRINITY_DN3941_c0_g3_i4.p1 TRINITY_DN3941_c0_g3~~TRINITY_DN3941_c0_g3_i4.p1  ORF type:complete len:433 (-),score=61.28 TRINITY_DN3941_c0_g3_i4:193-1491(-)
MEKSCGDCKRWMEHFYWTHFETKGLHFFRILSQGYTHQLMIPKKFMMHLKEELSETVLLMGPSGNAWQVGLADIAGDIFFKNGWPKFVQDHSIKLEEFLLFRYDGNSCFNVLMFDKHGCEKEDSYFVGKFKSSCFHRGSQGQDKTSEESVEVMDAAPSHVKENWESRAEPGSSLAPSKKRRKRLQPRLQFKHLNNTPLSSVNMKNNTQRAYSSRAAYKLRSKDFLACLEDPRKPHAQSSKGRAYCDKQQNIEMPIGGNLKYPLYFMSKRRPVSEEEISRTHQLASAAIPSNGFVTVMKPTAVCRRFFMTIPVEFVERHLPQESQDIILRDPSGKTWIVKYKRGIGNTGALDGKWADFVMENNLEVGDSCLFVLTNGKDKNVQMDVRIFRVIEDVVPLTRCRKFKSSSRKFLKYTNRNKDKGFCKAVVENNQP